MAVNQDLLGREFPPTSPYLVGREKVREFARAVDRVAAVSYTHLTLPTTPYV